MPDTDVNERAAQINADLKAADEKRRADAEGGADLSKIFEALKGVTNRMDALEKKRSDAGDDERDKNRNGKAAGEPLNMADDDMSDRERRAALSGAQMRADAVASARGNSAPRPLEGERPMQYRRRMLVEFKNDSADFRNVDIHTIPGGPAFDAIEQRIYADAVSAANNPHVAQGQLLPRKQTDLSGRQITTFYGEPKTWMSQFAGQRQSVVSFRPLRHD